MVGGVGDVAGVRTVVVLEVRIEAVAEVGREVVGGL